MNIEQSGAQGTPSLLTQMERAELLLKLSHQMMTQYQERRNLEWRMHVLLWTLLVAGAYFIVNAGINVQSSIWAVLLVFVLAVHAIWTGLMQSGEGRDQDQSVEYRRRAETVILAGNLDLTSIVQPSDGKAPNFRAVAVALRRCWLWNVVVLGTTALMSIAIILVVYARAMTPPLQDFAP